MATSSFQQSRFYKIAKKLTGLGIAIVPTYPGFSGAALDRWTTDATTDMSVVDGWIANGYELRTGIHLLDEDHNWVCVSKFDGVGGLDIDNVQACLDRGMPQLPTGGFIVDTPGGGVHVPFIHTDETRKLGSVRNVYQRDSRKPIFELKGNNQGWCAPWQTRLDGGIYKPRDGSAPLMIGMPEEHINWLLANSEAGSTDYKTKGHFQFHPGHDREQFLLNYDCTEYCSYNDQDALWVVVESCPLCGKNAKKTTGRGGVTKFIFGGNSFGFKCHACGASKDELHEQFDEWTEYIYEDDDPTILCQTFEVEDVDQQPIASAAAQPDGRTQVGTHGWEFPVQGDIHNNDSGNAMRLTKLCGYDFLWVEEAKGYYVWNDRHWEPDPNRVVMLQKAKSVVDSMFTEATMLEDDKRNALVRHALESGDKARLEAMVALARTFCRVIHMTDFDRDPMLINAANCTMNLRTGEPQPFDRNHLKTHCSKVEYKPDVRPFRHLKFMDEIMLGDQSKVDFLQRWFGYCLTSLCDEEAFCIFHGERGRNGKSKLIDIISYVLGGYAMAGDFDDFVARRGDPKMKTDLAEFEGKRLITAAEGERSKTLAEAKIKTIVSRDHVWAERKYQTPYTYLPTFKLVLVTNLKPRIIATTEAMWDKVILVSFNRYFEPHERDPKLLDKLKTEASGILNWLIEGCLKWQQMGLAVPEVIKRETRNYRDEQNVLGHWVEECCDVRHEGRTLKSHAYSNYADWAERSGEYVMRKDEFNEKLRTMFEEGRSNKGAVWKGFILKSQMSDLEKACQQGGTTLDELEDSIQ